MSSEPVLRVENVSKQVISPEGSLTILSDVSMNIESGDSVAIVGASGAGKSTLLALLAGLDLPTKGQIHLNGANLTELNEDGRAQVRAESVGFVFQSFHLLPSLNALENVMLPLELGGADDAAELSLDSLQQVGLGAKNNTLVDLLSGGEQQRVSIARAYAVKPKILFADEPTGNLDPELSLDIMNLFRRFNEVGVTTLIATHDLSLLEQLDYRRIELADGEVIDQGNIS